MSDTSQITNKYKTVVIDPPYDVGKGLEGKIMQGGAFKPTLPYLTMSDEEILSFPIDDFADKECSLFIWTTHTKLPFTLELLQKWGFKYHALITWDKCGGISINGFYRKTEFVVYGYRGKQCVDVRNGKYIPTLIKAKKGKHSEKPSNFYALLRDRTVAPRIDIFARQRHFGFDSWGNQVESQIQLPLTEASL